ncbi:FUSC family protein [Streptomyces sp. NPDC058745]|uniref:FUSC family protein n=1 Tax=Streptomyces sp. NPDC058745 TaxID=3346621 RepID=UPI00367C740B
MSANGADAEDTKGAEVTDRGRRPRRLPAAYVAAARRSLRVTLAAGTTFYFFLYGLDQPVAATYALFAAVSLAGLARIPGTGRQRAGMLLRLLPVAWFLVAAGTLLAVQTWSAVAGMLVIGFVLAFVAVGGPRPAGAAPGLQLLYILPSFPPFAPEELGERLIGATTGILLLVLAEAFVFPEPPTVSYRELSARAALAAERCAADLARAPFLLSPATAAAAAAASEALRPSRVPEAERPAGPGVRSRGLAHAGLAARTLLHRLVRLPALPPGHSPTPSALDLLHAVGRSAADSAALLRGAPSGGPDTAPARERAALAALPTGGVRPPALRRRADLLELADAASALARASGLAVRGREAASGVPLDRFWYARMRAPRLWWLRLVGNAGSRSVFFQNAVRISLALAAARAVAGIDTLPHGFWAMLATLSLTRTTLVATRAGIRQAVAGTLLGALATAGILAVVGTDTTVYAAVLIPVLLLTFTVGPVKGVGWAQALFAITVALVFAQLAPATWQLAEVRLLDVLVGSAIGAVFGLLAWPRGAQDEVRRSTAVLLRSAAEAVVMTSSALAAGGLRDPAAPPLNGLLRHSLVLAESAFAQFQSEPTAPAAARAGSVRTREDPSRPVDWQAALLVGHHTLWGAERVLLPPASTAAPAGPVTVPPLEPAAAAALTRLGERVAGRMLLLSAVLDENAQAERVPVPPPLAARPPGPPPDDETATEVAGAWAPSGSYAADAWLRSLLLDLDRITGGHGGAVEAGAASGEGDGAGGAARGGRVAGERAASGRTAAEERRDA